MGLFTVDIEQGYEKVRQQVIITNADKPLVKGWSSYSPQSDELIVPEFLPLLRLFYTDRNIRGDDLFVPESTIGRVYVAGANQRHLFPTAVVLAPLDRRAKSFGMTEIDLQDQINENTDEFCKHAVAEALIRMSSGKYVELSGVPTA